MIEVYQINGERALACAKKFGFELDGFTRVFIMQEDEDIGAGVLCLDKGIVYIKHLITHKPFAYFDLLARSVLAVVRNMSGLAVRIKKDSIKNENSGYFFRFGFKENGEFLELLSDEIDLSGTCGKTAENGQ